MPGVALAATDSLLAGAEAGGTAAAHRIQYIPIPQNTAICKNRRQCRLNPPQFPGRTAGSRLERDKRIFRARIAGFRRNALLIQDQN
jgi:hypothetical protein